MADFMWTLDEALNLIRALQPSTRKFNYHLCLGGGVLNKGGSQKDLDLYFLPLGTSSEKDADDLQGYLESLWGKGTDLFKVYPASPAVWNLMEPQPAPPTAVDVDYYMKVEDGSGRFWDGNERQWYILPKDGDKDSDKAKQLYKKKLKFLYMGKDRIDVFIL